MGYVSSLEGIWEDMGGYWIPWIPSSPSTPLVLTSRNDADDDKASGGACEKSPGCSKLGLNGLCCPTAGGWVHDLMFGNLEIM